MDHDALKKWQHISNGVDSLLVEIDQRPDSHAHHFANIQEKLAKLQERIYDELASFSISNLRATATKGGEQ